MYKYNYNTIAQAQRRWQSFPRIWLHEFTRITLIQFKSKRIGQGTKAVHIKSAPNNVVSVNDTNKKNTILVKKQKEGEKMDTILNQQQQQPGISGGKGKVREGGRM